MLRRLLLLIVLVWMIGFGLFAAMLPKPRNGGKTDGVVVLTGGEKRIDRGLQVLRKGWAKQMLVSGVDKDVKPREFQVQYKVSRALMQCCITLGYEAINTRSNAREAARWMALKKFKSVRLVTTDWHMRRAAHELDQMRPKGVLIIQDAVESQPSLQTLFLEYHKLLSRHASQLWSGR